MHRIDGSTATPEGLFTEGSPTGGVPATVVRADWLNDLQENVAKAIENAGITLVKGDYQQLSQAISALGAGTRGVRYISSPGSSNFTVPAGVRSVWVEVMGGGGGGAFANTGSGPTGGSGGGIARGLFSVTPGQVIACTVGTGGAGGATLGSPGVAGTASTFGSLLSATGGMGGRLDGSLPSSGVGSGGFFNGSIGRGGAAVRNASNTDMLGGYGGGAESPIAQTDASTPTQPGNGGGGRTTGGGAPGAAGAIIIRW